MQIEDRHGKPWERYEFILVLNLYMQIPFPKIGYRHPDVVKLAGILKRTPSSVALRLTNFAACDPILSGRNIVGMQGGKAQCMPYWQEFVKNREALMFESETILAEIENVSVEKKFSIDTTGLSGEYKERIVKTRVNQDVFRRIILSVYENKCALTGIKEKELLVASHIKPWSEDAENRLNPQNGICLSSLYDQAFDSGLMGFDTHYKVVLSPRIKEHCEESYYDTYFGSVDGKTLTFPYEDYKPDVRFLEYHMDCIFKR